MQSRIGGDEFALITESKDPACVEKLQKDVLAHNEEAIV